MSKRMEATAATILEKYDGDLDKLREAAGKDPEKERQLVKEFKVVQIQLRSFHWSLSNS